PFGALPTGVRAAATMNASFIKSVSQRLAGFERVLDPFERFGFTAQAQEHFAFEVHNVLLGNELERSEIAAAENVGEFGANLLIVITNLPACLHLVENHLECRQAGFAYRRNVC